MSALAICHQFIGIPAAESTLAIVRCPRCPLYGQMDCFQIDRDSEDAFKVRSFGAYGWAVNARNSSLLLVLNRGTGNLLASDGRATHTRSARFSERGRRMKQWLCPDQTKI